jgi:AcrR family transcriptional regulator
MAAMPSRRSRGESAGLSRERICDAAIKVMDRHGLDAVTIRSVATRLRVHPSALYNHVRDKDHLVEAMTARCFERLRAVSEEGNPADELRVLFRAWRDLGVRHPGLMRMVGRGMAQWRVFEDAQSLLRRAGLDSEQITSTFVALVTLTVGSALVTAEVEGIGGEAELRRRLAESIEQLPGDDYPTLRERAGTLSSSSSLDALFEQQLDLVLVPLRTG